MSIATEREPELPRARIAPRPAQEVPRLGRRWVSIILIAQAIVLACVSLTFPGDAIGWLAYPIIWPIFPLLHPGFVLAFAVWILSIWIAPMMVLSACLTESETPFRTLLTSAASGALTGVPFFLVRLLF